MLLRTIAAVAASSALATVLAQRVAKRLLTKPSIPSSVDVPGCGAVAVFSQRSGGNLLVSLDWDRIFGKLPFKIPFCSAVVTEDGTIYVSGSIGLAPPTEGSAPSVVSGGPRAEMVRTMQIIQAILRACGADIEHITMAHCFLVDNTKERFAEMNAGYLEFMNGNPLPARITVGCTALALGSCVEVDVIAKR